MTDLQEYLTACFSTIFPDLSEKDIPLASTISVGDWDSLATVRLVNTVEQEFGLRVAADDLEEFTSFESILRYLRRSEIKVSELAGIRS